MPQYQGIWSLPQQSQALTNQQWVTDPDFRNTTLLLQADGTGSGSQNHTFLDGSTNNFHIARNGNTSQGSFSPFSEAEGSWSNYFSGGYLRTTSSTALGFSTNAFTIEAWVYMTNRAAQYYLVGGSGVSTQVSIRTDGALEFGIPGVGDLTKSTNTVPLNEWTHIAYVRSSTSSNGFAYYINGVQSGTATLSTDLGTASATVEVGLTNTGAGVTAWTGYISNVRVIKGTALYTSNFIPSTQPLTAIANTSLLTCQSYRFIDNSTSNATFTSSGISVRAFSPFAPSRQWTPEVVGGSAYFDGTGDYLATATSGNFVTSGDFTMEAWAYNTGKTNDYQGIIVQRSASGGPGINTTNSGVIEYVFGGTVMTTVTMPVNQWFHVAMSRSGGGSNNISMYFNGTRIAQATNTGSTTTNNIAIGRYYTDTDNYYWRGYISSTRYTTSAVYSGATITVPTAPVTAITNTQLLLNYSNAGIYDATCQTNWETKALRDGTVVNTIVKKNGSGSFYFDGTQAYAPTERILPSENYPSLIFSTGDFTIESWLYCIGKPTNSTTSGIWDQRPGVNGTYINFVVDFGGYGGAAATPTLVLYADSATRLRSDVIPLQRWFHAVLCRRSGITRFLIDGKLACTPLADTRDYGGGGSAGNFRPVIGQTDGGDAFYGFMDDFRASRFCRYIGDFIPPKQAFPRQ